MKLYLKTTLALLLLSFSFHAKSQVEANNDAIQTGPSQKIKIDVTKNDNFMCEDYTLSIVNISPSTAGTAKFDGDYLVFMPASGIVSQSVNVTYKLECSEGSSQAVASIFVRPSNLPLNIIQTEDICINEMSRNVQFGIQQKFIATSDDNLSSSYSGGYIQSFQIPLVGDVNGDGKPEIIALSNSPIGTLDTYARDIYIFDGQTGEKIYKYNLSSNLGSGYGDFRLGHLPYHQSPSYMVIADVDNDGIGEIIVCQSTYEGKVYALKPILDADKNITGLTKMWDGEYGHKAPLNPTGSSTFQVYGQPIPNIVDINGDGIPELIVYNKIYNAQTGKLLMAWDGTATTPKSSSLSTGTGLTNYNPGNTSINSTYANNIKARAMVGRRPSSSSLYNDLHIAVPAIVDIDGDGAMEIITGNRIHKFSLSYLGKKEEAGNHTLNTYTTIEGPSGVTLPTNTAGTTSQTYYFNDGFTRVADIDGDGKLEAVVFQNSSGAALDLQILTYVWNLESGELLAASSFYSDGDHGTFGIPFIGDINDRLDGRDVTGGEFTKKLPEICLTAGRLNRTRTGYRSGLAFHPQSNMTNQRFESSHNQIVALTYDGGEAAVADRLKISWALEHQDYSNNTGITMFDFNNDGAFDLCYRDEETLRVISPKLGTSDYIRYTETGSTNKAILFRTNVYSETGFEAPAIADVNMDGSADIIVTGFHQGGYYANIHVFEHASSSPKWAPSPPVWNQALYNPLYINEDLTVPAKPISMLTEFLNYDNETIKPYNGAWIQQPIVKEGGRYVPVVRQPDAVLVNMTVEKLDASNIKVKVTIRNDGLASINATAPIHFYQTEPGSAVKTATFQPSSGIGVDVFAGEKVEIEYIMPGTTGHILHCRLIDDGTNFPALGYEDCDQSNNYGFIPIIKATNDYYTVYRQTPTELDVTSNDIKIGNTTLEIVQQPEYGTAGISDSKLTYTATHESQMRDVLRYILKCEYSGSFTAIDTAFVYLTITNSALPDNIITDAGDCIVPFEEIVFEVKQKWYSAAGTAHGQTGALVGDLDKDGIPEIITFGSNINSNLTTPSTLNVLNGNDGSLKYSMSIPNAYATSGWLPVMTAALVDSDGNGMGEIIFAGSDLTLTSYEAKVTGGSFSLEEKWSVNNAFVNPVNSTNDKLPQPIIADFNADGVPEVVVYNRIFNAKTGAFLGYTEADVNTAYVGRIINRTGNTRSNFLTTADFDGDGKPEIAAGGKIYKVNISEDGTSATSSILYQTTTFGDGFTAVADLNLDGKLDVVVIDYNAAATSTRINIWSPTTNEVIQQINIANTDVCQGYPFIGDIDGIAADDGKHYPEICVVTRHTGYSPAKGRVNAYKYNSTTGQFASKWEYINSDNSGGTGITLFDFNNDGINEIVYRDQDSIRILNGVRDGVSPILAASDAKFYCTSGTAFEYPLIVDIDGSGSAKICVTCANNGTTSTHTLNAFESATTPWAPTRKVWNQVNYEPTMINEDLTVPKYPFPKQSMFKIGDKEYRPFNGALIQVPIMDLNMEPVVKAADPYIISMVTEQQTETMARVSVTIGNQGQVNASSSLPVTLYGGSIEAANIIETKPIGVTLQPGNTVVLTFDILIEGMATSLTARLQDDGSSSYPATGSYSDCDRTNNTLTAQTLMAKDDYTTPEKNTTVIIDVLKNDMLGGCNSSTIMLSIKDHPINGVVEVVGNKIKYTPDTDYAGNETFTYKIACGTAESFAMVHVSVVKSLPDNIITDPDACIVEMKEIDFGIKEKWSVTSNTGESAHQKSSPLVGDLDGDGIPEVVVIGKTGGYGGFKNINVFDGATGELKAYIEFAITSDDWASPVPFVLVDADANGWGEIVYVKGNEVYSYETSYDNYDNFQLTKKWGPVTYDKKSTSTAYLPQPLVADFNGDGKAEIVINNCIFDGTTGALLGRTEDISNAYVGRNLATGEATFAGLGDFDGDGLPELVAGAAVYKINIEKAESSDFCKILSKNTAIGDGFVAVADLDIDGKLEVVVGKVSSGAKFYTWRPSLDGSVGTTAGTFKGPYDIPSGSGGGSTAMSFPFVGDIDGIEDNGKYYPEICFSTINAVRAFRYNSTTDVHEQKWFLSTSDGSGGTGITLFDFDNDGASELVYRDMTHLRIIDGRGTGTLTDANNLAKISCNSGTAWEYPVVADVDGDGSANILVTSWKGSNNAADNTLVVFESNDEPWSPTRKVWNQAAYDPVQINDNLTTPAYPLPKQTAFVADGINHYPFNGTLMQVPIMNLDMKPVVEAADPYIVSISAQQINTTTVTITVTIGNQGASNVNSSLPVSVYAENISAANLIKTKAIGVTLQPGNTTKVIFEVPIEKIDKQMIVRLQDDGTDNYPAVGYNDCNESNNTSTYNTLMAVFDFASPVKDQPITIDVLDNDFLGTCDIYTVGLEIASSPANGVVEPEGSKLKYTPATGYVGNDSFTYRITCGAEESTATVTIIVNSTLTIVRINDASEPNVDGKFRIKFTNEGFSLSKNLEITYTITPINAEAGDYYPVTGVVTMKAGNSSVDVDITPINNFKVEGNSRQIEITLTGATIIETP